MSSKVIQRRLREEQILLSLNKMKFATREHLQGALDLGGDRNANKVLGQMKELVNKKNHMGRNVYYISKYGAEVIGCHFPPTWSTQVDHHLLRNDMYVHYGCPKDWKVEARIRLKPAIGDEKILTVDAQFVQDGVYHFIEVDRTQSMIENKKKIEYYALVDPLIQTQYNKKPILVFYTTTPTRRETLSKLCEEKGLDFKIYTKEDLM